MTPFDENSYRQFFAAYAGNDPFDYQVQVARGIFEGRNLVLHAPTGAGKTLAVIMPFLQRHPTSGPARLIYALPLRTLVNSIHAEARQIVAKMGLPVRSEWDDRGREIISPFVTLQTGEQPDDRFFDRGRIIVTTYDQVLSGLLAGPYGLSNRLHNVNTATIAGSLVVFDEFHLMQPDRALLTAVAMLKLFGGLCQSVWMTATATKALEQIIQDALSATTIPGTEEEAQSMLSSLPSVSQVTRQYRYVDTELTADSIIDNHMRRSLVVVNTVRRAQSIYSRLLALLQERGIDDVVLLLLHSKFFKQHREEKEKRLRVLFGKQSDVSAVLIATQVIEAGVDISCEQLHTELCPMNALVQRAGRCARYAREKGTVHVYELPSGEDRAWMPYGDADGEDAALRNTRDVLSCSGGGAMDTGLLTSWVEQVHADSDTRALAGGWKTRQKQCLGIIEQNAILREPVRVADLIRGSETEEVRVIVSTKETLPVQPGLREGLSISRRSLYRLLRDYPLPVGWVWDSQSDAQWREIDSASDIARSYVLCLTPEVAGYDLDLGLRIGTIGSQVSPVRRQPPAPGYAPLRAEPWSVHAQRVAEESSRRLERDRFHEGPLSAAFEERYGLRDAAVQEAVRAAALLHDLGKLQQRWQQWAEAAQRARSAEYRHVTPLAHTDFDPNSQRDREVEATVKVKRPPHAAASALVGATFISELLPSCRNGARSHLASACTAAVLSHHGGWLPCEEALEDLQFCASWQAAVNEATSVRPNLAPVSALMKSYDKKGFLNKLLNLTCGPDALTDWWPLVAFLMRTLRLSDQRATAEGAIHE